jgi:iron complex outermembrane receptor protein
MSGRIRTYRKGLSIAAALLSTVAPFAAMAQIDAAPPAAEAGDGDSIIVTGSRIRRDPLEAAAPITSIDKAAIDRTGLTSIADVLQRLPGSAGGLNSRFNRSGNNGNPPDGGGVGAGSAEIDLRYLGSRRSLVLLDGQRFVNGSSASGIPGAVDLNAIPEGMIERVEVLRDGASTIYGSDAIAGVVNIITKSNQKGFLFTGQLGAYEPGDGVTQSYGVSWGTKNEDSGTSLVVGVNYNKQGSVFAGDRAHYAFPTPGATACTSNCSGATPLGRISLPDADGNRLTLTLRAPVTTGAPNFDINNPTGGDYKTFTTADRFNFRPYNYLLTPNVRYGGFVNFKQAFSDAVNLNLKFLYNHRSSDNQAAPVPISFGPEAGNGNLLDTIVVSADNPYNPFGELNSDTFYAFNRRFLEGGPRHFSQTVDTMYVTGGLDGKFSIGGGDWYWDVNATYGTNDAHQTMTGNVNAAKLVQALGPVANCTGDCVPFNMFGGFGSVTQAMLDYVTFEQNDKSSQTLFDVTGNITGSLFELPAGPLGVAVGVEHRRERGTFDPDPIVAAGLSSDIPALPSAGSYHVNEVYGELSIPILKGVPFFDLLEGSAAARYSDYSTSGSNTTLKAGLNWKPFSDLRLRGTWAQGFRAPSIGELFGARSRFDGSTGNDPCSNYTAGSATTAANCAAAGVPANYVQLDNGFPVVTGGNTLLKPEKSESWVFGGVYSPSWARNNGFASSLSLEVDYYSIKVDNAISPIDPVVLLSNCYDRGDALSCSFISRTGTGTITQIRGVLQNIGGLKSEGIDATLTYRSPAVGAGTIGFTVASNFLLGFSSTLPSETGSTTIEYKGTEQAGPSGTSQAYPKFKATGTLDWSSRSFMASLTGRYIDKVTEPQQSDNVMKATFYLDAQFAISPAMWDNRYTLTLGINNVLAKRAPDCLSCGSFDPTTYDMPDRFGYARLTAKF